MKLAILIPMFNEEKDVVYATILNIIQFLDSKKDVSYKVFVYDDGSHEDITGFLKTVFSAQKVKIIRNSKNHGQGYALKQLALTAILDGNSDYFVTFDADGQHKIQDAYNMCKLSEKLDLDVVLGSRFIDNTSNIPFLRRILIKIGAYLFKFVYRGVYFSDIQNGLRVFNRKSVGILTRIQFPRMEHSLEILGYIAKSIKDFKVMEFPVKIEYTRYSLSSTKGESTIDGGSPLKRGIRMVKNYLSWYLFSKEKASPTVQVSTLP